MADQTHAAPDFAASRRALCGQVIVRSQVSRDPSCPECLRLEAEAGRQIQALEEAPFDRRRAVKHQPFDPTAGYRPRRRRQR